MTSVEDLSEETCFQDQKCLGPYNLGDTLNNSSDPNYISRAARILKACTNSETSGATVPTLYESFACQSICGFPTSTTTASLGPNLPFYSDECIRMLTGFCLNSSNRDISSGNSVVGNGDDPSNDTISLRNYPVFYSKLCITNLSILFRTLTNQARYADLSTKLEQFCTGDPRITAHGNFVSPISIKNTAETFDYTRDSNLIRWVVVSARTVTEGSGLAANVVAIEALSETERKLLLDKAGATGLNRSANTGAMLIHLNGVDGIKEIPRDIIDSNRAQCLPRRRQYAESGWVMFRINTNMKTNGGVNYIDLLEKYFNTIDRDGTISSSSCNENETTKPSDAFVLRSSFGLKTKYLFSGRVPYNKFKYYPTLNAKIVGMMFNFVAGSSGPGNYEEYDVVFSLKGIYVNTPFIHAYETINCGCFDPLDPEQDPSENNNATKCKIELNNGLPAFNSSGAGTMVPANVQTACRYGWNEIPHNIAINVPNAENTNFSEFEMLLFRNPGTEAFQPGGRGTVNLSQWQTLPGSTTPVLKPNGIRGAFAVNRSAPDSLARELCACHQGAERMNRFEDSVSGQALGNDDIHCYFPGCTRSRFPNTAIATSTLPNAPAPSTNSNFLENIQSTAVGVNTCSTSICDQTVDLDMDGGVVGGSINAVANCFSISRINNFGTGSNTIRQAHLDSGNEDLDGTKDPEVSVSGKNVTTVLIVAIALIIFVFLVMGGLTFVIVATRGGKQND